MFFKAIKWLQQHIVWTIPASMVLGIFARYSFLNSPTAISFLKSLILPLTFVMIYPTMIGLQPKKLFEKSAWKTQILAQIINFCIIPFMAFGFGTLFFSDNPAYTLGLLLAGLLPTSGMTISWTGFAYGNLNAAVSMTLFGLIAGSLATPLYTKLLMGTSIEIPLLHIFKQIGLIVFVPLILGIITKKILVTKYGEKTFKESIKPRFGSLAMLGALGVVFVVMAIKANTIIATPYKLAKISLPILLLYLFNFVISTIIAKLFCNRGDGIALVYGTVMRNLSIAIAIAMTAFQEQGASIALVIAISFIIQAQLGAWYVRFTNKIFGKPSLINRIL